MLNGNKAIYTRVANLIPDWKTKSRTELLDGYVNNKNINPELANSYIAAVMCSYWNAISKYKAKCKNAFNDEDYHEWLTHAVLYATNVEVSKEEKKNRPVAWRDASKAVSKKKDAANIVINQCIASTKAQNYQKSNYLKYQDGYKNTSLEELREATGDKILASHMYYIDEEDDFNTWFVNFVHESFNNKHYVRAFVLAELCAGNPFVRKPGEKTEAVYPEGVNTKYKPKYHYGPSTIGFSKTQLIKNIASIDERYCRIFAGMYNVDVNIAIRIGLKIAKALSFSDVEESAHKKANPEERAKIDAAVKAKEKVKSSITKSLKSIKKGFESYKQSASEQTVLNMNELNSEETSLQMCC